MVSPFSSHLKSKARALGFQKVGIVKAVSTPNKKRNLDTWLQKGHNGRMEWIEKRKEERGNIFQYFPEAKSIISLGINYYSGITQTELQSDYMISNYAWGDDYHDIIKPNIFKLLGWLKEKYPDVNGIVCTDTSPVMEKVWAQKAGLGWQGKHTNLITRDYGSWLFLGELILDIELEYDDPFTEDLCGTCTTCIDACPTHALGENEIYADKCISYLSIEHRGNIPKNQSNLHGWIYGCDICQEVCPWNIKFAKVTSNNSFQPRKEILMLNNSDWHQMDDDNFRKLFKGSAIKRTKFTGLNRNIQLNKQEKICQK